MSAEWRHVDANQWPLTRNDSRAGPDGYIHRCRVDAEPWPCDAERMRVERDAAIRRAETAEKRVARIIAAYEKTHLEHDVAYEDFVDVVVNVRQLIWFEERDARAAPRSQEDAGVPQEWLGPEYAAHMPEDAGVPQEER